uniref:Proton-coupled zinc antiporter SLC30A5 n=1 Tax=Timema douglasi TaxID=61478 RepID=A0A7R8VIX3_TIMDO|nr:unnamed protein product [Timema douglasi]
MHIILYFRSGTILLYIQKPLTVGQGLTRNQWISVVQYSIVRALHSVMWFYGITLCGPFRSILVSQHYDIVIIAVLSSAFSGVGGPARTRGVFMFLAAIVALLFLDHDEEQLYSGDGRLFSNIVSWLGLADHKLGVLLLVLVLLLQAGVNILGKRLSQTIGGIKRLNSLSSPLEGVVLLPETLFLLLTQENKGFSFLGDILPLSAVAIFIYVINFYVDAACIQRLELPRVARIGSVSLFLWALLAALLWGWPYSEELVGKVTRDHTLSGGGLLKSYSVLAATLGLTSSSKLGAKGSLVGYSSSGLPLYNFTNSALHHTSRSILRLATGMLKQVLMDNNSRRIFYFLCLNLTASREVTYQCFQERPVNGSALMRTYETGSWLQTLFETHNGFVFILGFTMVEFMYGVWTNSLGLISDGFHMLFDCSALVMGLLASVMARWKPSKTFSYGYSRVEDLSGFINGLFLLVISLFVFSEAITRLIDPPHVNTHRLLIVHSHTHGSDNHHNNSHGSHGHSHNANMQGVFLHVMADTLGSVGVIFSSILIDQFGWYVADPVCSIFIAVLIFLSVLPLLKHSALVLLLRTPRHIEEHIPQALNQVFAVEGIVSVGQPHFWQHSSKMCIGSLHIQASPIASEQNIIQQVIDQIKTLGGLPGRPVCNTLGLPGPLLTAFNGSSGGKP